MIKGTLKVPGDKSITHRALIFSALVDGVVEIENISSAQDCLDTSKCLGMLGLDISRVGDSSLAIKSPGLNGLIKPDSVLNVGNSGTTIRILAGLLCGRPFDCQLDGDDSIRNRPMARIIEPLELMGAEIDSSENGRAPLFIKGKPLTGKSFDLRLASAQVQTSLLLAGLQAEGQTTVRTPHLVRDHTRRMFEHLKIPYLASSNQSVSVAKLSNPASSTYIEVPSDISSAAFFLVLAACSPDASVVLNSVGVNPGRIMILNTLSEMGADIKVLNTRLVSNEPVADIRIKYSGRLSGVNVKAEDVPKGIDEIPILALCASFAEGETVFSGIEELKHKESDRLNNLVSNLNRNGASAQALDDKLVVTGKGSVKGGDLWETKGDHRMAMTGKIASILFDKPVEIDDFGCVSVSYPEFQKDLDSLLD